ncbi:hypothetical protein KP509_23G078900 [Ceratopteris richardii]|uniref:Uncharacterized protein n=1 Tax=Ceratopteris richardii TaxID=49495 RepID=A0A8T2S3Y9_CERRI|nr:hypothetical protein KP509_23G078900 [Ceratopteris richardii]
MAPSQSSNNDALKVPLLRGEDAQAAPPDYLANANWLSYLFFYYTLPLIKLGNSQAIAVKDIPTCPADCRSEVLISRFHTILRAQRNSGKLSIRKALWQCLLKDILITGFCALLKGIGILSGPIFIYFFVEYATGTVRFQHEGIVLVVALSVVKITENLANRHWYFGVRVLGSKAQSIMMAAVHQKEFTISSAGRQHYTSGEIVNLVSVDGYRLCELAWKLHWGWLMPFVLLGALAIAYVVVGIALLPALAIIIIVLVGFSPLIKSMQQAQGAFMDKQDLRMRATTEILQGMKVVKLQAWEEKFNAYIQEMRSGELKYLAETQIKRMTITVVYWLLPTILTCVVFITCLLLNIPITSVVLFTVLATFRIVQDPVRMSPEVFAALIQGHISLVRLEKFLQEEDLPEGSFLENNQRAYSSYPIRVQNASLSWQPKGLQPTLQGLNIVVKQGEKVAICGSVGSGKSSFLLGLLGEMPKLSGSIELCGRVAYVPQSAWIQTMTVRDNILFGKVMDKVAYKKAVRSCALDQDIKSFSHGDLTEIGERGTNLSGGQKQRIQIARAVYNDADVYLLDDPFSAVDAQTSAHLFHECVMGALKDKTVILVTHQMEYLPLMDTILVMQDGEIKQAGSYDDLLSSGPEFQKLIQAHKEALHTVVDDENGSIERPTKGGDSHGHYERSQRRLSREESLGEMGKENQCTQLVQEEEVVAGKVGLKPYADYINIPGIWFIAIALVVCQVVFSGVQLFSNLWLALDISRTNLASQKLIWVYSALCLASFGIFALRTTLVVAGGLKASESFLNKLMVSIMKAPMSFFDATPSGRILNRVSTDMSVIDLDIPIAIASLIGTSMDVLSVVVVSCIVRWEMIIIIVPALAAVQFFQSYQSAAGRELNRTNATTKAPIVNKCAETLTGCATIRAFRQSERFKKQLLELIDRDLSAYLYKYAALEWQVLHIDLSCTLVLIVAACLVVIQRNTSGGFTGLAITYALSLNNSAVLCCVWQGFLSIFVVSIERVRQYLDIPSEAPAVIEDNRPPAQWPHKGDVHLEDLLIRYREHSPLVLKGITCTFYGGQKVGVVGRTGSGKTTLISALFRLVEPAGGKIIIDGIDICSIGLHDLRFRLGIIPQEPVLFQGSIRTNFDPLNQYNDLQIWELADVVEKMPLQLESPVSDGGENWSAGQRQLFCLGRVMLKQSQVLVLDEATASIDSATDVFLQKVIREEFSMCTVITVAHRIPTIIDSDMVLTLSDGKVIEFDNPKKLVEQRTSLFSRLVAEYWAQAGQNVNSEEKT